MTDVYTTAEQTALLKIARNALIASTHGQPLPQLDLETLPASLQAERACFVTLEKGHDLRGCTGVLMARRPLAEEIAETAVQTALYDPRFNPVQADELMEITIEISVLTPPKRLTFEHPEDIPHLIRPNVDGVTLRLGANRATFLPQVWEQAPKPEQFLGMLCRKMGLPPGSWKNPQIDVETYQAIVIREG